MAILHVERLGGLAGLGGTRARILSQGRLDTAELSPNDLESLEALFQTEDIAEPLGMADGFRYRITRATEAGTETVVAPESVVPEVLTTCIKDEWV